MASGTGGGYEDVVRDLAASPEPVVDDEWGAC